RRTGGSRLAQRGGRAHDILLDHHVGRTSDDEKMLDVVAADKDEATPAVDRCLVDHGEGRPAAAPRPPTKAARPHTAPTAAPQREEDEQHDHEEKVLEAALSFAE